MENMYINHNYNKKKALYKLEGLFEENEKNFYTYDKSTDSFGDLTETKNIER